MVWPALRVLGWDGGLFMLTSWPWRWAAVGVAVVTVVLAGRAWRRRGALVRFEFPDGRVMVSRDRVWSDRPQG